MFAALLLSLLISPVHADEGSVQELINHNPVLANLVTSIQAASNVQCLIYQASTIGIADADFEKTGAATKWNFSIPCVLDASGSLPKMLNISYFYEDKTLRVFSAELLPQQR